MQALQKRIDSFTKAKRVKNPSKSSFVSIKWGHPTNMDEFLATPEALAEAGFYFNPSYEDRDNVACFVCDKQLSDWEADDDPFDIHWTKCRDRCCWAIVRCGLRDDINRHGGFTFSDKARLPTSKAMEKARLETFFVGDGWVHDQVKRHGADSRKMARAGFVYTPSHPGDDLATCLYCYIALGGWEPEDDPTEEHRKRSKGCPMFDSPELTSKPPRTQPLKPASKFQSTKHSRSVSQSKHTDIVQPIKTHDGDADESDTTNAATSSRRSTRTASSSNKGVKTQTISRSQSRSEVNDVEDREEETVPRAGRAKVKKSLAPASKKARSRSKSVAPRATTEEEDQGEEVNISKGPTKTRSKTKGKEKAPVMEDVDEAVEETKSLKKSTRGRPPVAKAKQQEVVADEQEEEIKVLKKSTRGRPPAAKANQQELVTDDEEEIKILKKSTRVRAPSCIEETDEDEEDATKTAKKAARPRLPSTIEEPTLAPRKASKARKGKVPEPEPNPDPEVEADVEAEEAVEEVERKPRASSKSRAKTPTSRKPSRIKPKAAPSLAEEPLDEQEEEVEEVEEEVLPAPPPVVEKKRASSTSTKHVSSSSVKQAKAAKSGKATPVPIDPEYGDHEVEEDEQQEEDLPQPVVEIKKHALSSTRSSVSAKPKASQSKVKVKPPPSPPPEEAKEAEGANDVFVIPPDPLQKEREARRETERQKEPLSDEDGREMEPLFIPKRSAKSSKPTVPSKPTVKPTAQPEQAHTEDVEMASVIPPKKVVKEAKPRVDGESKPVKEGSSRSSETGMGRKASILKVVEISTDEEGGVSEDERRPTKPNRLLETMQESKYAPKVETAIEVASPPPKPSVAPAPTRIPTPSRPLSSHSHLEPETEDIKMDGLQSETEPLIETQNIAEEPDPRTPEHPTVPVPASVPDPMPEEPAALVPNPFPMPALSKIPFTPVQNLTDAELDMTVEEWIRYQMDVEYDKFKRDGEREIGRFKKRAEEVKEIIERL
ncbi:hypothetical protein H0H87_007313 [Tephrocybe sp. NHM501043]|nr:hypothetical protein H0H87_007313 [Tephrocybe sp. NHM501043]